MTIREELSRRPPLQVGLLAALLLILYALGASPTIYVGDSGELVAAVDTLGIPHPSGYPLYVLLGKLWTLVLPVGSIAYRMSLFSAATAAAACGGLYWLGRRLALGPVAALFASLLLAFAPSFWSQANIQRVYSLNALLMVAALIPAVEWHRSRDSRLLFLACFLATLGSTNHTYMGVFALGLGIFALVSEPGLLRRPRVLAGCVGAGLLGLLPYLYMPLRSRADPRLDWGNPETLDGLLNAVLRGDAWIRAWIEGPADLLVIGWDYLRALGSELLWLGLGLAALGLVSARRRRWPWLLLLLAMAGNFATMALHGSRTDLFFWHRYYIPSFVVVALLAGLGCQLVIERLSGLRRLVPLLLPAVLLTLGYAQFDRSRFRVADDFSRTLLASLPPGAHLSASDDNVLFVLIYLTLVEGVRPDVDLIMQGVGDADLPPLRFDPDADPLFFTHHPNWSFPGLEVVPRGLYFQVVREGAALPAPRIPKWRLEGELDPRVPKDYLTQNLVGHFHYMLGITHERSDWQRAEAELDLAAAAAPENDVLFYNLGLIYRRNGLVERALAAFERSHEINPRHIATKRDVRASDRIEELRKALSARPREPHLDLRQPRP